LLADEAAGFTSYTLLWNCVIDYPAALFMYGIRYLVHDGCQLLAICSVQMLFSWIDSG